MNAAKPRLLVYLGAGASVALGMPSTPTLTEAVVDALRRTPGSNACSCWPREPSEADLLITVLNGVYPPAANFEHILHALESLASLRRSWEPKTVGSFRVVEAFLCDGPSGSLVRCFDPEWLYAARDRLYREIQARIVEADLDVQQNPAWSSLSGFFRRLETNFDLHVVTTNYDTIVEQALGWGATEQGFDPVANESVSRFGKHPAPSRLRLIHLHGSVHYGYRLHTAEPNRFIYEDDFHDLYWHESTQAALETWFARSNPSSQAGRDTIAGPIITGLQKPDKLLVEPYLSFFRHFEELAVSTPRILVVGYGFGDVHINAVLSRLTKWHGAERRIVAIDHWPEDKWVPSSIWEPEKQEFFARVAMWARDHHPMDSWTYPDPWMPAGGDEARVRIYFRGFAATVDLHADDIVRILA